MTPTLLIDAVVRQTMVLVAALATSSGYRAPLAHIADQVFGELVAGLKEQGLTNRLIADMFGMALRTYQHRVARVSASRTVAGASLWAAVHDFIRERGSVRRAEALARFSADDDALVRSAIRDLVDSGLVEVTGKGPSAELHARAGIGAGGALDGASDEALVLVAVHDAGRASRADVRSRVALEDAQLDAALARVVQAGTVRTEIVDGVTLYTCDSCVIPFGDEAGWAAAVFDHYQALVSALVTKLSHGTRRSDLSDHIGGSTFTIDLWEGHPMESEVLGGLKRLRETGMELRQRVKDYNDGHARPADARPLRVVSYVGQTVKEEEPGHET